MSLSYDVNKFLDSLEYKFDLDRLHDKEYFKKTYDELSENLLGLKDFREKMKFYGFPHPYYPLKGLKGASSSFRKKAQLKKSTYERNSYAISAHKIALGHLSDAVMLKNDKTYKGREALNHLHRDLTFCENEEGVYRLEILGYIPFSGDYMVKLSNFSPEQRKNYRKITKIADKEKGKVSSVSLYMKRKSRRKKRHVSLEEYRNKIKNKREIENFKLHRERGGLIKNRYTRKILSISYAPLGVDAFLFDLAMFYLKKGKYERERYAGIFPTLAKKTPEEKLGKYEKIIKLKEKLEEELQKLGKYEKSLIVGGIAYYRVTGDLEKTLGYFKLSEEELKRKIEEFERSGVLGERELKPKTQKFLEHLQR